MPVVSCPHAFFSPTARPSLLLSRSLCKDDPPTMSLRAPSLLDLLRVLQQHGLAYAQLAAFASACQAHHRGQIIFEVADGQIRTITVQPSAKQRRLAHD